MYYHSARIRFLRLFLSGEHRFQPFYAATWGWKGTPHPSYVFMYYYSVCIRFLRRFLAGEHRFQTFYAATWGWKGTPHPSYVSTHFGLYGPNFWSSDGFICNPVASSRYCAYNTSNVHLLGPNATRRHRDETIHSRNSPSHAAACLHHCPSRRD
jgi:hypothetical protein